MKKILVSMLAVAAMVACSNEHTLVEAPKSDAIGFDTFVDKTTRAAQDITTTNIANFGVYASVTNGDLESGLILTNEPVTYDGAWSYEKTQYWVAGNTYNFTAIAPYTGNWTYTTGTQAQYGTINFKNDLDNAKGEVDLLFASAARANVAAGAQDKVGLTFDHLLSKVAFKFTNGFAAANNMTLEVYGVKIEDAVSEAKIEVVDGEFGEWAQVGTSTFLRTFGKQAADKAVLEAAEAYKTEHFYLIPQAKEYTITFTIDLYQAGVKVGTYTHTLTPAINFAIGGNYCISATLGENNTGNTAFEPIEFTVDDVAEWVDNNTDLEAKTVATAQELVAAIAEGGEIRLTEDINLDAIATTRASSYGLFIENDCVIDGNGHVITTTASRAIAVSGANDVTLKNFTLNATGERGLQVQGGAKKVTIENVTATSANYTVSLPSSAGATNVTINNCDLKGLNTINVAAPGAVVTVNNTIIRCEDNVDEGYSVVCINKDGVGAAVTVNGGEVIITGSNPGYTCGGSVEATDATLTFNETKGNTTIRGYGFAIEYGDYYYSFPTFEAALAKAVEGETIILLRDVNLTEPVVITKEVIVDLNDKNISSTTDVFEVAGGALTIIGDGEVHAATTNGEPYCAVWAYGDAVVNIYGGTYKIGYPDGDYNDLIYAKENAVINIYGGKFYNSGRENSFVLNIKDDSAAQIVVYGGEYEKFNPADNESEGADTNFLAPGKTVEQNGDWYIVK